jgi:hypothetical protein
MNDTNNLSHKERQESPLANVNGGKISFGA